MINSTMGKGLLSALALGAGMAGAAQAGVISVSSDISTSTVWTANNTYKLTKQIYVLPGATLTIAPGVVIASDAGVGGSLAVTRGAQIFALGTQSNPIIFTSSTDVASWAADPGHPTGKNPKTGTWHEGVNEWGNLTLMGKAYISEDAVGTNTQDFNASNYGLMEGLTEAFPGDPNVRYGGGDDDDDSGTLSFVSLRYGGKVVALNNELNGLSMGGIGRGTCVNHIDIMNNVDDGVETWGGTVNYKYMSVWNIGDDSFDIDQGWRGKAQFIWIVQGYGANAAQGSGVGDNCFETDGAEDSDAQPVTTAAIYNATVIGQPVDGDQGTAWRDNARIQYHNCIFMDLGEVLVKFDNVDGDGANGYGFNGTLSWADTWTTDYTACAVVNPPVLPLTWTEAYQSQVSGKLASITDSVFFRNLFASAYTEATARGVFNAGNNNVLIPGFADVDSPIKSLVRGPAVVKGGKTMLPVIGIDPRPNNAALTSVGSAPADGFFTPAAYRGAFAPNECWASGWTAAAAYGYLTVTSPWSVEGCPLAGTFGKPELTGAGELKTSTLGSLQLVNAAHSKPAILWASVGSTPVPFKGGTLCAFPFLISVSLVTGADGTLTLPFLWPAGLTGVPVYFQVAVSDTGAVNKVALSNALRGIGQ